MSTVHADIAVVGGELCALAAGAALAHAGHRVVVIDDEERGDTIDLGGFPAPIVPTLWRMPSNGPSVTLVDKLGLRQDAKRALGEPEPLGVVDDPDVRMEFPLEAEARTHEFTRVFGDDDWRVRLEAVDYAAGISLLSEALQLHDDGFFARRREKKRVEDLGAGADPASPALKLFAAGAEGGIPAILEHLAPFVVHDANPDANSIAGLLALARIGRGTLGGCEEGLGPRPALRRLFLQVIEGHGGDVITDTRVKGFEMSGKRVTHVKTSGKNDYAIRVVVDGTKDRSLPSRLPSGRVQEKAIKLRDSVVVKGAAVIRRWLIPRAVLPRGTASRLLLLPSSAPLVECPSVLVGIFDAGQAAKPETRTKAKTSLRAATDDVFVVAAAFDDGNARPLLDRLDERLDLQFPFARKHARAVDVIDEDTARLVAPAYASAEGSHALGGRRPRDAVANWARAGRDLTPRFGIEGEMASAQSVAALVETMFGKK